MNTNRLSGYGIIVCPVVFLFGFRMLGPVAEPPKPQPIRVELKLDNLPSQLPAEFEISTSSQATSNVQMELDDGQPELAYGINDETSAYQFIWFNRFTPQPSDFPFVLTEIWVLFDDDNLETGIFAGDQIDLVVYTDADGNPANGVTWLATYPAQIDAVDGLTWTVYNLSSPLRLNGPGDVLIGVINRFVTSGISDLSYPAACDSTASQERSWLAWWNTTDPDDPPGLSEAPNLMLLTGENAGNWLIRGYGNAAGAFVYLPIVQSQAALPAAPILYEIENADGDGSYTLNWSSAKLADSYTVQEDDTASFSSPMEIYHGSDVSKAVAGQLLGSYYYRVRAENSSGFSGWSETRTVQVTQLAQYICETHNFGTGGVSYLIQPTGYAEHFTAQNNMHIETLEVKSVLKAFLPLTAYMAISVNDVSIANHYFSVSGNAYLPYYWNRTVSAELHVGDDIKYYISKFTGDPSLSIMWGNYVKLCGSPAGPY